jgi:hypothetical protein
MRLLIAAFIGAAASAAVATIAFAGGGPPPGGDPAAPEVRTVVTHGNTALKIVMPRHRSDRTIERAVRTARREAFPRAVKAARREAGALAAATGLTLAGPLGAARDATPVGYYDTDSGSFGPGRWCGPIYTSRTVVGSDGIRRRVRRSHHGCPMPRGLFVRVTVTFAAR